MSIPQIPYSVCKGTIAQRYKIAKKFNMEFFNKINTNGSIDRTKASVKLNNMLKDMGVNNMHLSIFKIPFKLFCKTPHGSQCIKNNFRGYEFYNIIRLKLGIHSEIIRKKNLPILMHETMHMFSRLCNPKISKREFKVNSYEPQIMKDLKIFYLKNVYKKENIFNRLFKERTTRKLSRNLDKFINKQKNEYKVDILQAMRYSFMDEQIAYRESAKFEQITKTKKWSNKILKKIMFYEKIGVIENKLKEVIAQQRTSML